MSSSLTLYRFEKLAGKGALEAVEPMAGGTATHGERVFTRLELLERTVARGYCEAHIVHRERVDMTAVWHGELTEEVVAVHPAQAFYARAKRLFAIGASRHVAKQAVDRLNRRCPEEIELRRVDLDLDRLLDDLPPGGSVLGAWSSTAAPDHVTSRAMFGEGLEAQSELSRMRRHGRVSSLSLAYPFGGTALRVNVSARCSAVFFGRPNLEIRLRFMEHLASFDAGPGAAP